MFNLEQAITEWRRQMTVGGIKSPAILDELESHLREERERLVRSGTDAEKAFAAAVQKIGSVSVLKDEFNKSAAAAVGEKLMMAAAVLVLVFGAFLSTVTVLLCYLTAAERFLGFIAIGLTFGIACGWPAFVARLPVVQPRRKLQAVQVACLAAGFAVSTFYVQVILHPYFEHRADGMLPPVGFLAIFPIAVGFALAAGLDRAAARSPRAILT